MTPLCRLQAARWPTQGLMRDSHDLLTRHQWSPSQSPQDERATVCRQVGSVGGREIRSMWIIVFFLFCSHSLILCRLTWPSSSSPVLSMESALAVVYGQSWSDLHRQAMRIVFRSCDDVSLGRDHKSLSWIQSSHSVKHTIREEDL